MGAIWLFDLQPEKQGEKAEMFQLTFKHKNTKGFFYPRKYLFPHTSAANL